MLASEMVRTLVEYEAGQWQRVWQSVRTLSPELAAQSTGYAHDSVQKQMFHVTEVLLRWLRGLQGDPNAIGLRIEPADVPTLAALEALHLGLLDELRAFAAGVNEAALAATLPGMRGPTWHVLIHLVNHGTDHRAQVLAALHALDAPTFAQDLIFTLWFPQPAPWSKPLPTA